MRQGLVVATDSAVYGRADAAVRAGGGAEDHLVIEDGWVFREHHGKYVECICRSDELSRKAVPYKGFTRS